MSIYDENHGKKLSIDDAVAVELNRQKEAERLKEALKAAEMNEITPILRIPDAGVKAVINEALSKMHFKSPKIIRKMPDGTIRARKVWRDERADDFSFDIKIDDHDEIWIFKDGYYIANVHNGYDHRYCELDAETLRKRIVETLAAEQLQRTKTENEHLKEHSGNSIGYGGGNPLKVIRILLFIGAFITYLTLFMSNTPSAMIVLPPLLLLVGFILMMVDGTMSVGEGILAFIGVVAVMLVILFGWACISGCANGSL